MKSLAFVKILMVVSCITITLLGVSYARFTDKMDIVQNVTTANMNYVFETDGKNLNVFLGSDTASELLLMNEGDTYQLVYNLKKLNINDIELKNIQNEYLGTISIELKSVNQTMQMEELDLSSYLPGSLGDFDCYHDFDGMTGKITLVKKSSRVILSGSSINLSALPSDLQEQIKVTIEEKINTDDDVEQVDFEIIDDTIGEPLGSKNEGIESPQTVFTLTVEGTYCFEIPLHFDQYNAK